MVGIADSTACDNRGISFDAPNAQIGFAILSEDHILLMNARIGRSERRAWLSALAVTLVCLVFTSCRPNTEQTYVDEFRKGLDSIEQAFCDADYAKAVRFFENIHAIPLTKVPLADEARYWKFLYRTGFETDDFEVAIQAAVASFGLDWDEQDVRAIQPYIPMAHALKKAQDTAKAIEWYNLALANVTETVRADVTSNLASLYVATGQYRIALEYTDESIRLNRVRSAIDPVAVAWTHVIKARAYGGLAMYQQARLQLDSALEIFQHQRRTGEPYGQKDVRMSLYRSLWRDSLNLCRIGGYWQSIKNELLFLYKRDSAELATYSLPKVRKQYKHYLRGMIPHYLTTAYHKVSDHLDTSLMTSSLIDSRGWRWVGTLRGLCIDIGGMLVPVETVPSADSRRPVRALSGDKKRLHIHRYDGSTETVSWNDLIGQPPSAQAVSLPSVTFTWVPWKDQAPSGVVGIQDSTRVLYFVGNRYGFGSLQTIPADLVTAKTSSGVWHGTVFCGYTMSTDTILLGTDHGLWVLTPSSAMLHKIPLAPGYLNNAQITSIGRLSDGSVRITIPFFEPVVFKHFAINSDRTIEGIPEKEPYLFEPVLAAANPIVTYLHGINSARIDSLRNRPAPLYSVPIPALRVWIWGHVMYLHDAMGKSFTLHTIPHNILLDTSYAIASLGSGSNIVGVVGTRGMLVGAITKTDKGPAQRIVAYRTPTMTHFKVATEGASIPLNPNERDVEVVTGRPFSWGKTSIRQSFSLPWSGQNVASRTNRIEYIRNIPVGEHHLDIRSDDRYEPIQMAIAATPMVTETAWFRAALLLVFLGLATGTFRYIVLLRRTRRDDQERLRNAERLQIGQDVHDAVGADLVRISLVARTEPSRENSKEIARLSREASRTLRDIIWSVSEAHTLDAVIAVTLERVRTMSEEAGISFNAQMPSVIPPRRFAPHASRDIVLIVTEALTNVIKHAQARHIQYIVECDELQMTLSLVDDGIGFDADKTNEGVGIKSIRSRAQRSGLGVQMTSAHDVGTSISVTIPFDAA